MMTIIRADDRIGVAKCPSGDFASHENRLAGASGLKGGNLL
jgi:hypothetical protein